MIESIGGGGFTAQAPTAPANGKTDDGFASTLASIGQAQTTSPSATAAPSTVLGSPGWFSQLFASPAEEQAFATDLTQRLQAAGVDTSSPIALTVDSSGHVKAKAGTPDSQAIDAVFAGDSNLENAYKKIANTEETTALARTEVALSAAYGGSGSDAARAAAWQRYSGAFNAIAANAGNLTLAGGSLR